LLEFWITVKRTMPLRTCHDRLIDAGFICAEGLASWPVDAQEQFLEKNAGVLTHQLIMMKVIKAVASWDSKHVECQ
jgi:hypothetical protein